mgnify:CR=1 FL=1
MNMIANKDLGMQVKKRPTTSQQVLWELTNLVPVSMITLHTRLSREQIKAANEGVQDLTVYEKLICFWSLLQVNKELDAELETEIMNKEEKYLLGFEFSNGREISNYADKHGV